MPVRLPCAAAGCQRNGRRLSQWQAGSPVSVWRRLASVAGGVGPTGGGGDGLPRYAFGKRDV